MQGALCTLKKCPIKINQSISPIARARQTSCPTSHESGARGIPTGSTPKLPLQLGDPESQLNLPRGRATRPPPRVCPSGGVRPRPWLGILPLDDAVPPHGKFQALQLPDLRRRPRRGTRARRDRHCASRPSWLPSTSRRRRRHLQEFCRESTSYPPSTAAASSDVMVPPGPATLPPASRASCSSTAGLRPLSMASAYRSVASL